MISNITVAAAAAAAMERLEADVIFTINHHIF
jgi:hypothetical protein